MKLLGSTNCKITKNKIGENVPYLEIIEIALVRCNIVNNDYQQHLKSCLNLFLINRFFNYYIFHSKSFDF